SRFDYQLSTARHSIASVDRQIHDHLFHLPWICSYAAQPRIERTDQIEVFTDYPSDHLAYVLDHRVEIDYLRLKDLLSTECQKLACQFGRPHPRFSDLFDLFVYRVVFANPSAVELAVAYNSRVHIVLVVS